jgi:hypothetical protein
VLRQKWCQGLDYYNNISKWAELLITGQYQAIEWAQIEREFLERRETLLNVSSIFHVIIGARTMVDKDDKPPREASEDHIKTLAKLLELGADIKAKDAAGYTPLHHCLTSSFNVTTMAMAETLLEAGADPNAQNRFGCSPINECVMVANLEGIKLLLKHGARTDIKENGTDVTCISLAKHFPDALKLFSEATSHETEKERAKQKEAGCFDCSGGCGKRGSKRCKGCYLVTMLSFLKIKVSTRCITAVRPASWLSWRSMRQIARRPASSTGPSDWWRRACGTGRQIYTWTLN